MDEEAKRQKRYDAYNLAIETKANIKQLEIDNRAITFLVGDNNDDLTSVLTIVRNGITKEEEDYIMERAKKHDWKIISI